MPRRGYGPSFRSLGEENWGADTVPPGYCNSAVQWAERLGSRQTVLDVSGICGLRILDRGRLCTHRLHTLATGSGQGRPGLAMLSPVTARKLAPSRGLGSWFDAGVIVANGLLLGEVEQRGWESFFYDEWRVVWYRYAPGHDAGFDRLAVFVDMPGRGLTLDTQRVESATKGHHWLTVSNRRTEGPGGAAYLEGRLSA